MLVCITGIASLSWAESMPGFVEQNGIITPSKDIEDIKLLMQPVIEEGQEKQISISEERIVSILEGKDLSGVISIREYTEAAVDPLTGEIKGEVKTTVYELENGLSINRIGDEIYVIESQEAER